ncbi:MAG: hypothetical protein LBN20_00465 [Endomicrobium sp.]|jgi:3-hydroxymyristoyl/3-hydroxydecanoyl-(acyl carrier protein) dehydratase|nr:hypothetical protein [Endomicrobium sp.]
MNNIETSIKESFKSQNGTAFVFFLDKNFAAFKGHFPHYPLLPGIVQIEIVLFCIKKLLNNDGLKIKEIKKVKFAKPIFPKSQVDIEIIRQDLSFKATVKCGQDLCSQIALEVL